MRTAVKTRFLLSVALAAAALLPGCSSTSRPSGDIYAKYVWPKPPDKARIRLQDVITGRVDVEGGSTLGRILVSQGELSRLDKLRKPFGVEIDPKGRILVTDPGLGALVRIDRDARRWDVFGTVGSNHLKVPLGLGLGPDGSVYVADSGLARVVVFAPESLEIKGTLGAGGALQNPVDVAVSKDGQKIYVADSKAHKIVVFDAASGKLSGTIGHRGNGEGEFNFPTAIAVDRDGNLFVNDSMNSRIEIFSGDGSYVDEFGRLSTRAGGFVRPKDVAIDEAGFVYVTDAAFNNIQIFNSDLDLLTFVGAAGTDEDSLQVPAGVAARGEFFAVVDQLRARVLLFRYLLPRTAE